MNKKIHWLLGSLLLVGFVYNVLLLKNVESSSAYVQLYIENETDQLTGKSADDVLQKNDQLSRSHSIVIWGKKLKESLISKELNRTVETDVLALQGNSQILFPNAPGLQSDNKTSCLISNFLANKLFGSSDVKGLSIVYNEREYSVLGVVPSKESFFVYETKDEKVLGLNRMSILSKPGINKAMIKQAMNERLSVESELLDYDIFRVLLGSILGFLLVILSTFCTFQSVRQILKTIRQKKVTVHVCFLLINSVCWLILLIFTLKNLNISSEYLPSQASDFEFIKSQLENLLANTQLLLQSEKYAGEFLLIRNLFIIFVVTVLLFIGTFSYLGLILFVQRKNLTEKEIQIPLSWACLSKLQKQDWKLDRLRFFKNER